METDSSAPIGVRNQNDISGTPKYRVCGQHGTAWAGQWLRTFLGAHELIPEDGTRPTRQAL